MLRRYHNWLNRLPEKKQNEVSDTAPGERMSLVKKLVADYPVPRMTTAPFLQFIDLGDYSPFELAALFKIWQVLKPATASVKSRRLPALPKRHETLFEAGAEQKIPREIKPPDFDDKHWAGQFEKFARQEAGTPAQRAEEEARIAPRRDPAAASDQLLFPRESAAQPSLRSGSPIRGGLSSMASIRFRPVSTRRGATPADDRLPARLSVPGGDESGRSQSAAQRPAPDPVRIQVAVLRTRPVRLQMRRAAPHSDPRRSAWDGSSRENEDVQWMRRALAEAAQGPGFGRAEPAGRRRRRSRRPARRGRPSRTVRRTARRGRTLSSRPAKRRAGRRST